MTTEQEAVCQEPGCEQPVRWPGHRSLLRRDMVTIASGRFAGSWKARHPFRPPPQEGSSEAVCRGCGRPVHLRWKHADTFWDSHDADPIQPDTRPLDTTTCALCHGERGQVVDGFVYVCTVCAAIEQTRDRAKRELDTMPSSELMNMRLDSAGAHSTRPLADEALKAAKTSVENTIRHIHGEELDAMKERADPYLTSPDHIALHDQMLVEDWAEVEAAVRAPLEAALREAQRIAAQSGGAGTMEFGGYTAIYRLIAAALRESVSPSPTSDAK